jgi:RimJ/RimL family protein N-acetyltransferase
MLPIITERLRLRPLEPEDAQAIANLVGNWSVARWLSLLPFPYALADAEAFIVDARTGAPVDVGTVAAITREDQLIGLVSIEPRHRGIELGYWLGEPFWANGYMSEAATALVSAFFSQTGAPELHAGYFDGNHASARILTKLGFEVCGQGQQMSIPNRRAMPDTAMLLTRERYIKLHPRTVNS